MLFITMPTCNYSVTVNRSNSIQEESSNNSNKETFNFIISIVETLNILHLDKKKLVVSSPEQVYIKIDNEKIKLKGYNNIYKHKFCSKVNKIKISNDFDFLKLYVY